MSTLSERRSQMKQYLVPVRQRQDKSFAFMIILEAANQSQALRKAMAMEQEDLSDDLYVDTKHPFKEYE